MKLLLTSSAGGHFSELKQLNQLYDKYESMFLVEKTANTKKFEGYMTKYLIYGSPKQKLYIFKLLINALISLFWLIRFKPDVIVSTGVHSTIPVMLLGKILGKKVIYIETIANVTSPSRTGNFIYKHADLFIVQWEELLDVYPNAVYGGVLF